MLKKVSNLSKTSALHNFLQMALVSINVWQVDSTFNPIFLIDKIGLGKKMEMKVKSYFNMKQTALFSSAPYTHIQFCAKNKSIFVKLMWLRVG